MSRPSSETGGGVRTRSPNIRPRSRGGSVPPVRWGAVEFEDEAERHVPVVVLRGVGWRMVARYLEKFGGELTTGHEEPLAGSGGLAAARPRVLAEVAGKGWRARLHEEVEFTGALRTNRVEVSLSGEPDAVQQVVLGLRRMTHLEGR